MVIYNIPFAPGDTAAPTTPYMQDKLQSLLNTFGKTICFKIKRKLYLVILIILKN